MSSLNELLDAVRLIEDALDRIDDPVERLSAIDHVRADLAVLLTRQARKAAWTARNISISEFRRLAASQWRGIDYLRQMAKQHAEEHGLPVRYVKDIATKRLLDLSDLRRLRGQDR